MGNCEYVANYYNVPACVGRRVRFTGRKGMREGVIAEDCGNYIGVTFDEDKPGDVARIHPTDPGLEYLEMGKIRPMTRGQQKYKEYLNADWFDGTFAEWLGIRKTPAFRIQ